MSFLPVYLERESSEISKKIKDTIRSAYQKGYNDGWNELLKRADAIARFTEREDENKADLIRRSEAIVETAKQEEKT